MAVSESNGGDSDALDSEDHDHDAPLMIHMKKKMTTMVLTRVVSCSSLFLLLSMPSSFCLAVPAGHRKRHGARRSEMRRPRLPGCEALKPSTQP